MRHTLAAAAVLVALSGCGEAPAPHPAPTASCSAVHSDELYVQARYDCPDKTRVYTFANEDAREGWTGAATIFGAVVLDKGEWWVKVEAK